MLYLQNLLNPEMSFVSAPHYVHGSYKRIRLALDRDNKDSLRVKVGQVTNMEGVSAELMSGI